MTQCDAVRCFEKWIKKPGHIGKKSCLGILERGRLGNIAEIFLRVVCENVERNNNNNSPTAPLNAGGKFKFKKVISSPG